MMQMDCVKNDVSPRANHACEACQGVKQVTLLVSQLQQDQCLQIKAKRFPGKLLDTEAW